MQISYHTHNEKKIPLNILKKIYVITLESTYLITNFIIRQTFYVIYFKLLFFVSSVFQFLIKVQIFPHL